MKKTLLSILIILGLSYSTQSVADVKNLPIICSVPAKSKFDIMEVGYVWDVKRTNKRFRSKGYALTGAEFDSTIEKLMQNPKLILQQGFFNHEEKVKNLKLKCPRGSKMIKPYNKKIYKKNKQKVNPSYVRALRNRSKLLYHERETETIIFLIYLLSLENDFLFSDYKLYKKPVFGSGRMPSAHEHYGCDEWSKTQAQKNAALKRYEFGCLQQRFHITQAKKNGNKWIQINNRIIELDKSELKPENIKKINIKIALLNLPSICGTKLSIDPKILLWGNKNQIEDNNLFFKIMSEYPLLIFKKDFGIGGFNCGLNWKVSNEYGLTATSAPILYPYDKVAFDKGEVKFNESYLKRVKKLEPADKERLKFLINLITLNDNILLPSDADDKTKKTFKINFGNLKTAYDQLQNNETYQFVRKVNKARIAFKILLLLL